MLTVSYGTIIWMSIAFIVVLILLKKYAWGPILKAIQERDDSIEDSLQMAADVKKEMLDLQSGNEKLLQDARNERDLLLKDARETKDDIIKEAKSTASEETKKMIDSAREAIDNEKMAALMELKNEVGKLSLEIAETVIREQLKDDKKQNELVSKLLKEVKLDQ